jgi:hypothetical protein
MFEHLSRSAMFEHQLDDVFALVVGLHFSSPCRKCKWTNKDLALNLGAKRAREDKYGL